MTDDEALQRLVRSRTGHVPTTREHCPSPEALQAVAIAPRGAEHRLTVLEHVATCASCRRDFDLLRTAEAAAPAVARTTLQRRWVPALAAAAAVVVISLVATREMPDVVRGEQEAMPAVQLLDPSRTATGLQLQWHSVAQALIYRVEVIDRDGNVAFSTETADTLVLAPALRDGSLRWSVEARLLDGTVLTSALDPLRVTR